MFRHITVCKPIIFFIKNICLYCTCRYKDMCIFTHLCACIAASQRGSKLTSVSESDEIALLVGVTRWQYKELSLTSCMSSYAEWTNCFASLSNSITLSNADVLTFKFRKLLVNGFELNWKSDFTAELSLYNERLHSGLLYVVCNTGLTDQLNLCCSWLLLNKYDGMRPFALFVRVVFIEEFSWFWSALVLVRYLYKSNLVGCTMYLSWACFSI